MSNVRNKEKEVFIDHFQEIPKIQEDKGKKSSRFWNYFKCLSRNSHVHCDNANDSLFDDEHELEIGQTQTTVDGKRNFSPWEGTSSFSPPK